MTTAELTDVDPAWLPPAAFRALGARRVLVAGDGALVETVRSEVTRACQRYGGSLWHPATGATAARGTDADGVGNPPGGESYDLVLALAGDGASPEGTALPDTVRDHVTRIVATRPAGRPGSGATALGEQEYALARRDGVTVVLAGDPAGLLYGLFHVVRLGESAFAADRPIERHRPATPRRLLNHWDNIDVHPVMGQVERGYAGGSIFWDGGARRADLSRVRAYARLLAACGINAVSVNNVNVHATETRLLTDRLGEVAAIADVLRPYGIRVHLSVNFAAPMVLGGLVTADPCDVGVRDWWARTTRRVYQAIPDFGGYVVKADSEGQPGPFGYGRNHADGANALADALAPFGGVVHWRAFVYNHRQDWRDRSTDRARAAYDHFAALDGQFRDNAILQVKYGPIDFQTREPISPVIAALPSTRVAVEFQVTQEYTGQQRHVCYLGPLWSEVLGFRPWGAGGRTVADVATGRFAEADGKVPAEQPAGGLVAVSNVGDDPFWTGHPLAQANLYAFGRLCWDPGLDPVAVLDEWIDLTFGGRAPAEPPAGPEQQSRDLREILHAMMDDSWLTYERYTAPLGVGFMVQPGEHYGPNVDGYEYTPWGTYHFADRDGVGVDRTRATGTGFTGQYPKPWAEVYEHLDQCPDELLLFFHHVPYRHVLHSGSTVIQHIYDTHFAGVEQVARMCRRWEGAAALVPPAVYTRVRERLDEQLRCAREWCDQINTYFFRKSGVPDAHGRRIH